MKILITGGSGRIGFKLVKRFASPANEVVSISKTSTINIPKVKSSSFDLADAGKTSKAINDFIPDIVIHTAALTNVDMCETDPKSAYAQNVNATSNIIESCKKTGSKVVFVSSSFVFDGKGELFTEDSEPCPINYYGETKQIAEEVIKDSGLEYLILRTDQPYGKLEAWQKDDNVRRVLKALQQNKEIHEPLDWYNNPTYINNFVDATAELIKKGSNGIFNLVGKDFINRYEWAIKIAKIFDKDTTKVEGVDSTSFHLAAIRPTANISNDKVVKETGVRFFGVEEGLSELKKVAYRD